MKQPEIKVHKIEIDGIKCLAQRDISYPTYCQWRITEKQTGYSLMPSLWNPGFDYNARTLDNAICLVKCEVIDKMGKDKIQQRITEILSEAKP